MIVGRRAVLEAIAEFIELGRSAFLAKYGFRAARYQLVHGRHRCDTKAILGVAYGFEHGCAPLKAQEFSGGVEHCVRLLVRLGFRVVRDGHALTADLLESARRLFFRVRRLVVSLTVDARKRLVGLVSCSKAKLDHAAPARELYSASFVFERSVRYIERRCSQWWVLSAKHGLVHPETVLEPYDDTLAGTPKAKREAWAAGVQAALRCLYDQSCVKYLVLAGRSYVAAILGLGAEVEEPLAGMSTGLRRRWLVANT